MATSNLRFRIIGDDDASPAFLKVAAASKLLNSTFSDLGGAALRLTAAVGATGLVPVAAAASASLVELTTSAAAGAGALGIFGISVAGIGKDMVDAQTKITALDTKLSTLTAGTDEYRQTLAELRDQQKAFRQEFGPAAKGLDDMKKAFDGFKNATRGVTTNVMGKAFELIASVLPKLAPVANAAGRAVGGLIDELSDWTKSPAFDGLLDWFKTAGPKAITHFGHIIGNLFDGLGGILSNFVGPGNKAAASLDKLTKRFAEWGHSKGVSDSVDRFLKYVHDNGPTVSNVMSKLAEILPKLASALGSLGAFNLSAISMFLTLLASMPQGAFDVVVTGLFGIYTSLQLIKIALAVNALWTGFALAVNAAADSTALLRVQLAALWVQEKLAAAWAAIVTAAQWALNAALDANPIGIVVVAIAALVAGFIYAYKHSETFRKIVDGALRAVGIAAKWTWGVIKVAFAGIVSALKAVGQWGKWLWDNVFQPVFKFIANGVAALLTTWAALLHALSHVPGFGWAGDLADKLDAAAGKARNLAGSIRDIPKTANVDVIINVIKGVVHTTGGNVPKDPHSGSSGATAAGSSVGKSIMDGIVKGIAGRQVLVQTALDKVASLIDKMGTKIQAAMDKVSSLKGIRSGFQDTFTANSIFGTDLSEGGNIDTLLNAQAASRDQARQLLADIKRVTHMGLSKALVRQLQSQGTSGAAALHEIAMGGPGQIDMLNRLNRQTSASLQAAGMQAGNFVRGGSVNADIRAAQKQVHVLERQEHVLDKLEHRLHELAQSQKKDQTIIVEIDGEAVIRSIVRRNKRKGVKTAGV